MPLYEFQCQECQCIYEEFASFDEEGVYEGILCPKCESSKKDKLFGVCGHTFVNPVGTDSWNSDTNGHDYRYKWNLPNVQKNREYAEKNSHVGPKPYIHHDDISSGKNFDPEKW